MTDLLPENAPLTCSRSNESSRLTEIFFGTRQFKEALHGIGFYPFYHFNGSDHQEIEIEFNRKHLFAGSIPNTCNKMIINPKNAKHTKNFLTQVTKLHSKSRTMEALLRVKKLLQSGTLADREIAIAKARNIVTQSLLDYIDNQ